MFSKYSFLVFPKIIQTEISLFFIALPSFTGASFVKNFWKSRTAHDNFAQLLCHKGNVVKSLYFFLHRYLWRRNFSFVARYSLKFIRSSLLVVKSLVTRCKIRLLLVAEVESLFPTLWKSNSNTDVFLGIFAKL